MCGHRCAAALSVAHPIRISNVYFVIFDSLLGLCLWDWTSWHFNWMSYFRESHPCHLFIQDFEILLLWWLRAIPSPCPVSCYTIRQHPGANSPNRHNPRNPLPCCLCAFRHAERLAAEGYYFLLRAKHWKTFQAYDRNRCCFLRYSDACLQPSPKSNHIRCKGVNYILWNT